MAFDNVIGPVGDASLHSIDRTGRPRSRKVDGNGFRRELSSPFAYWSPSTGGSTITTTSWFVATIVPNFITITKYR